MSVKKKEPLIKSSTKRTLIHALLRSIPVLPGPELYDLVVDLKRSRASIDEKIERATSSLQEASQLVDELEKSLSERAEKLNTLRKEVERYSQLAEVEEGKANAIIQQLEVALSKDRNKERWVSLVINLIAGIIIFVLGVLLSPVINRWLSGGR